MLSSSSNRRFKKCYRDLNDFNFNFTRLKDVIELFGSETKMPRTVDVRSSGETGAVDFTLKFLPTDMLRILSNGARRKLVDSNNPFFNSELFFNSGRKRLF